VGPFQNLIKPIMKLPKSIIPTRTREVPIGKLYEARKKKTNNIENLKQYNSEGRKVRPSVKADKTYNEVAKEHNTHTHAGVTASVQNEHLPKPFSPHARGSYYNTESDKLSPSITPTRTRELRSLEIPTTGIIPSLDNFQNILDRAYNIAHS
jgi:hypothetical protein